MRSETHKPVLLEEILRILNPQQGEKYIDATINGGGHSRAILERIKPEGKLLGIDLDCGLIAQLQKNPEFEAKNIKLICDNYANLTHIAAEYNFDSCTGILFDLGFSSYHIEKSQRGFSFLRNEPLDMRYNPAGNDLTAEKIINNWPGPAIEDIFRRFGEERFARKITQRIVHARRIKKIKTTGDLVQIVSAVIRGRGKIHPATRVFQALRMAVNRELDNVEQGIRQALELLAPGGKIAIISFHSLEDGLVKHFFLNQQKENKLKILTPKPIIARFEEIKTNPRARSAKLRAAQRL